MSYLDLDYTPQQTAANKAAQQITDLLRAMYRKNKIAFEETARIFWANPDATPQEVSNVLGTHASGIFSLHAQLGTLIASVDPSGVNAGLSYVGSFTQNSDGTVTIN